MLLRNVILSGCASAMLAVVPAAAAVSAHRCECVPGKPTAASYTWNFKAEANGLFQKINNEARKASTTADNLQSENRGEILDWQAQQDKLVSLKADVNKMGKQICRLQVIRRTLAPWQQKMVNNMDASLQVMADNTQDAILFMNRNQDDLWVGTYQDYVNNLVNDANTLAKSAGNTVEYAQVRHEYRDLRGPMQRS